jgi:hypothetical protein
MRLPGTINRPNKVKREKGRVEALACVVEFDAERGYPLSLFKRAILPTTTRVVSSTNVTEIRPLASVDEDVSRLEHPRKPKRMSHPVWYRPF